MAGRQMSPSAIREILKIIRERHVLLGTLPTDPDNPVDTTAILAQPERLHQARQLPLRRVLE